MTVNTNMFTMEDHQRWGDTHLIQIVKPPPRPPPPPPDFSDPQSRHKFVIILKQTASDAAFDIVLARLRPKVVGVKQGSPDPGRMKWYCLELTVEQAMYLEDNESGSIAALCYNARGSMD